MEYPINLRVDDDRTGVAFALNVSGYLQEFLVSREALDDLVGLPAQASKDDMKAAFGKAAQHICNVAVKMRGVPGNNTVLIASSDLK